MVVEKERRAYCGDNKRNGLSWDGVTETVGVVVGYPVVLV